MRKLLVTILITNVIVLCMSASIIDFLTNENESRQNAGENGQRNCICNGPQCMCCLDFNISFVDLGGPGCVRLKYLSADEGLAINVSYGESLLHNDVIKGPDPAPTCLNIFAKLAQMCARFHGLLPTDDGMRGCLNLEPMLLGEPQLELPMGCFRMGPNGMEVIQSPSEVIQEQIPNDKDANATSGGGEIIAGLTASDILAAVNESAEQGIALISNWFGIAPNETENAGDENALQPVPQNQLNQGQYAQQQQQQQQQQLQQQSNGHIVFGS